MPCFTKQRKKKARNTLICPWGDNFGFFGHIHGRFRLVSAVLVIGRYDLTWPIRLDFGRISPVQRESKPIRHESSCIDANPREKKNADVASTRWTPRPTSGHVRRRCGTLPAVSVLSRLRPTMKKVVQTMEGAVEVSFPPGPSSFSSSL